MILFDTETTALAGPTALPLDKQPRIIELCCIKLDDKTLKEGSRIGPAVLDLLIHPGFTISEEVTRITGIHHKDLEGKPPFEAHIGAITEFFLGERIIVAQNCDFDCRLLGIELARLGREFRFPWPANRICTVEASVYLRGHRLKLNELFEIATGKPMKGAHRAINDVKAMAECLRWLHREKRVRL